LAVGAVVSLSFAGCNSTDPEDIATAILAGLENLPVEVTHSVTCVAGLTASLTPPSQIVTNGIASAVIKDSGSSFSVAVTNGEKDK
jgi:hypothetical protein